MSISFTIDLEDPTERYDANGRFVTMTKKILELCHKHRRRATFFTVGRLARAVPRLIEEIAVEGHEIAYHSRSHIPLTREDPRRFAIEASEDKDLLEQLAGQPVTGFRAPQFSLTASSLWALDILAEIGFFYSSSIMPTRISRYGMADAPRTPFLWPNGIVELPLPVARCGPLDIPYLGGVYMYALPFSLVKRFVARADPAEVLWTYTHPYDFDREEKFDPTLHGGLFTSAVLWLGRRTAEAKIDRILALGDWMTLGDRVKTLTSLGSYS